MYNERSAQRLNIYIDGTERLQLFLNQVTCVAQACYGLSGCLCGTDLLRPIRSLVWKRPATAYQVACVEEACYGLSGYQ